MAGYQDILKTKFFAPPVPGDFIYREALVKKANKLESASLLLVSAPSGYGKSVFVASWLEKAGQDYAWLSLDESEKDLRLFVRYLVQSIRTRIPGFGDELMQLSAAADDLSAKAYGRILVNLLITFRENLVLVLDDFHLAQNEEINQLIQELLRYPQPHFKLIIIGRYDPSLPLATWRMKNQLLEIRVGDLRFNRDEIELFIRKNRESKLSDLVLREVENLTEGWISGLRVLMLAAGKKGFPNQASLMASFSSSTYMYEMLNEVLLQQEDRVRHSLLRLSLLPEFDRDLYTLLCLEKDEQSRGATLFKQLVDLLMKSNLFLIRLDEKGEWYRFHHLFQDILQGMASTSYSAEALSSLRLRIAESYLTRQQFEKAITFFLKGGAMKKALVNFTRLRKVLLSNASWPDLEKVFKLFPGESVPKYSILSLTEAWLYVYRGNIPKMLELLPRIEILLEAERCDSSELASYQGELNALHAYCAYNLDLDMEATLARSKEAIGQIGNSNPYAMGIAWVFYGGAMQALGKSDTVRGEIYAYLERAENLLVQSNLFLILCYIYWIDGDLKLLRQTASHLIRFGKNQEHREALANGYYFAGIADYYMGQEEKAGRALEKMYRLRHHTLLVHHFFGIAALAFSRIGSMDESKLQELLCELDALAVDRGGKLYIMLSNAIAAALNWIKNTDPSSLRWALETDHRPLIPMTNFTSAPILQAYILVSSGERSAMVKGMEILEEAIALLRKHNNSLFLVRSYVILTLAHANMNEVQKRDETFALALNHAVPMNLSLPFRMLDRHLADCLKSCNLEKRQKLFVERILARIQEEKLPPDPARLLSRRETEILIKIGQQLSNKEIGTSLFISEKTVKRHVANIYKKLNARNRQEAIQLAGALETG